jgi:hypothetical protein
MTVSEKKGDASVAHEDAARTHFLGQRGRRCTAMSDFR